MFDIFDQPWTLLIVAAVAFRILDAVVSQRWNWWQWYLLILLIAASYLLHFLGGLGPLGINELVTAIVQLILAAAIIILLVLPLVRAVLSNKQTWWLWLLPVCLAGAAFASDWLVKTDSEKISDLIKTGMSAVEQENPDAVGAILSDDYRDSYHNSKRYLMRYCKRLLSKPLVDKNTKRSLTTQITPPTATAILTVLTVFDEKSFVRQKYFKTSMFTRLELKLRKQPDKKWLITGAEILQIDGRSTRWALIKQVN